METNTEEKQNELQNTLKKYRRNTVMIWIALSGLLLLAITKADVSVWISIFTPIFIGFVCYILCKYAESHYRIKVKLPDRSPMPWYFSPVILVPVVAAVILLIRYFK